MVHSRHIVWPFKKSDVTGRLYRSFDDDTMKDMETLNPFIAQVRQTRKTINAFKRKVSISIDGTTHDITLTHPHSPQLLVEISHGIFCSLSLNG